MTTNRPPIAHQSAAVAGVSSFGERVQRYRKRSEISGEELAARINQEYGDKTISRAILANIENGRRGVSKFDEIIRLAHGLRISPLALICDIEQPFQVAENPIFQGSTNASVAKRFLANCRMNLLPGAMEKPSRIMWALDSYENAKATLSFTLDYFDAVVTGKQDVSEMAPWEGGAVGLEESCRGGIESVGRCQDDLEKLDVIIPDAESKFLNDCRTRFFQLGDAAREKKIITLDDIQEYKRTAGWPGASKDPF